MKLTVEELVERVKEGSVTAVMDMDGFLGLKREKYSMKMRIMRKRRKMVATIHDERVDLGGFGG